MADILNTLNIDDNQEVTKQNDTTNNIENNVENNVEEIAITTEQTNKEENVIEEIGSKNKTDVINTEPIQEELIPEQRESEFFRDYFVSMSPLGNKVMHNELTLSMDEYNGGIDMEDPAFKEIYDKADLDTQYEMLSGFSNAHSLKIAQGRQYINEANKAIAKDGIGTQLLYGIGASLLSPTTLIPGTAGYKALKVFETANKMHRAAKVGLVTGVTATTSALIDEAGLAAQGYQHDYASTAYTAGILGGGLGFFVGALSGKSARSIAKNMVEDDYKKDYEIDNNINTKIDDNGNIQIVQSKTKTKKVELDDEDITVIKTKEKYVANKERFESNNGRADRTELEYMEIPKKLNLPKDSNILVKLNSTANDITKAIYVSASNSSKSSSYKKLLEKKLEIPEDKLNQLYNEIDVRIGNGETDINIFDIEPNLAGYAKERDSFSEVFGEYKRPTKEVEVEIEVAKEIELQDIGKMKKSIVDKIPLIGNWFKSDVHKVYQSDSSILRSFVAKIAPATVSLKDSLGNIIPSKATGMDYKRKLRGTFNRLRRNTRDIYLDAKKDGFKGTHEMFLDQVYTSYIKKVSKQENSAYEYANSKMGNSKSKSELKKYLNEYYDNDVITYNDNHFGRAEKEYNIYFGNMLKEGNRIGIKELSNINTNKLYVPRVYDIKRISKGGIKPDEIKQRLTESIRSHKGNEIRSDKDLKIIVDDMYEYLAKSAFDSNLLSTSYTVSNRIPFGTHLKGRKILLDDSKMGDLLVNSFEDIVGLYHYKMSGRFAVQDSFGTTDLASIAEKVKTESIKNGEELLPEDLQSFDNLLKDMIGELRINELSNTPAWSFTRNLLTYNSLRMGGGFGGNQVIEMFSAALWTGIPNLLFSRFGKTFKDSAKLLYGDGKDVSEFSEMMINSGYMENALFSSRMNRYADTELGFNSGKLETTLNKMNDSLMKYNGLRYFVSVMEDMIGGSIVNKMMKGNVTEVEMARWGLDKDSLKSLREDMNKHIDINNDKFDLESFSEINRDRFQLAITRGMDELVIQGDSIHLPNWMKAPNHFSKVIFQFMRFPMLAQEILLRRGMTEEQSKFVGSIVASSMTYIMLKHLREEASVQLGFKEEYDRKYDYFNDVDHLERALAESMNYIASAGFTTALYNYGAIIMGEPELGRDWTSGNRMDLVGPSAGLPEDLADIIKAAISGDITDEKTLQRVKSLMPFLNLPVLNEGMKHLIQEIGE